jgi:hypothetical protein
LAILTGGCSPGTPVPGLPRQAPKAEQSPAQLQRLRAAKAAAALVLADVEVCETAVIAGAPLDDLSKKTAHARDSVLAFSRTENGRLLPKTTAAIALAAKDYFDSCTVWRADEKAAPGLMIRGLKAGKSSIDDYRHPDRYEALWVKGGIDLGKARTVLRDSTL